MKTKKMPHLQQGGTKLVADARVVALALKIERIRAKDPDRYERIMRKLAELERPNEK